MECKEVKRKTCSVKGCNSDREGGDLLFCKNCREKWIKACRREGVLETQVDEGELNRFLKAYQKEGLKLVVKDDIK